MRRTHVWLSLLLPALALALSARPGAAQSTDKASIEATIVPPQRPPAAGAKAAQRGPEARKLFGGKQDAAPLPAQAIGFYSKGCLAGGRPLPIDGPNWQVMRLSRNRNWGHPSLIAMVQRLAADVTRLDGWPGLLVGDMAQPRGGPMLTGHASHQSGLDADIWLTPMPDRRLSEKEREDLSATSMLGPDGVLVDPNIYTAAHGRLIRRAASYPDVERVLVHPGIKKALCLDPASDKATLAKIRPFWGHHYHMHVRMSCPRDSVGCQAQKPTLGDDGCGKEIDDWITLLRRPPPAPRPVDPMAKPPLPKPQLTLADLPPECRMVLEAGTKGESAGRAKGLATGR